MNETASVEHAHSENETVSVLRCKHGSCRVELRYSGDDANLEDWRSGSEMKAESLLSAAHAKTFPDDNSCVRELPPAAEDENAGFAAHPVRMEDAFMVARINNMVVLVDGDPGPSTMLRATVQCVHRKGGEMYFPLMWDQSQDEDYIPTPQDLLESVWLGLTEAMIRLVRENRCGCFVLPDKQTFMQAAVNA